MRKALVIGAVLLVVVAANWAFRNHSTGIPHLAWEYSIPAGVNNRLIVAGTNEVTYVLTSGSVVAIDAAGKRLWETPKDIGIAYPAVVGPDGSIYTAGASWSTNSAIVAFRPDGAIKWPRPVDGIVGQDFALAVDASGAVIVGDRGGNLIAIDPQGEVKSRIPAGAKVAAPVITPNGRMYASGDFLDMSTTNRVVCLGSQGKPVFSAPGNEWYPSELSVDWDQTVYIPGRPPQTMRALNPDGSLKWTFLSSSAALSAPTIGSDGSLYFRTTSTNSQGNPLFALDHNGKKLWELALGNNICFGPPVVASDGTLFVVDSDPKVTAVNPDGTVKWVFKPKHKSARRVGFKFPRNWREVKDLWARLTGDEGSGFPAPPVLTANGVLRVGFGSPYDTIYGLEVGVGPCTNSPWPMEGGNPQRTRQVAKQPPGILSASHDAKPTTPVRN